MLINIATFPRPWRKHNTDSWKAVKIIKNDRKRIMSFWAILGLIALTVITPFIIDFIGDIINDFFDNF